MSSRALRFGGAAAVAITAAAFFLSVGNTYATFTSETENAGSTFATNWVEPPTGVNAVVNGDDVSLTWTQASSDHATGQEIDAVDNFTNTDCSGVDYAGNPIQTWSDLSASSYNDIGAGADGDTICFAVVSTIGSWREQTTVSVQLGP